jgi:ribose transport system substrate-binding protein
MTTMFRTVLLASGAILAMQAGAALAQEDAAAYIAQVTAPSAPWSGPTTGPAAQQGKTIVYISTDQRNGGAKGVGEGAEEAATILGWDFRTIDGQGSVSARSSAMSQAIALQPDGIILGGIDAAEQAPLIEQASEAGIKIVGWHAGAAPGPIESPPVFTNITTDPLEVAKAAGLFAVADSGGKAGVVIFTDSAYAIAIRKSDAIAEAVKSCGGCEVLSVEDTPLADVSNRMPQLTTSLLSRFGEKWTHALGINDLYFDFSAPALQSAGIAGDGAPRNISAGDGSESAFQRIRANEYQIGTVAEPLKLHGWQVIDEMNRALAGEPESGFVAPVHLFTPANIDKDGGPQNVYDPENGYRDAYKKIWGKS